MESYNTMSDKITTTSTYVASGTAVVCGYTINEVAAMAGVIIALMTFILNAWFKWQHLKLAERRTEDIHDGNE